MVEKLQVLWTEFASYIDQHPIVILIAGLVCLIIGIIRNTSQNRESNFNGFVVVGVILFVVGLFKMSGLSFISF